MHMTAGLLRKAVIVMHMTWLWHKVLIVMHMTWHLHKAVIDAHDMAFAQSGQ